MNWVFIWGRAGRYRSMASGPVALTVPNRSVSQTWRERESDTFKVVSPFINYVIVAVTGLDRYSAWQNGGPGSKMVAITLIFAPRVPMPATNKLVGADFPGRGRWAGRFRLVGDGGVSQPAPRTTTLFLLLLDSPKFARDVGPVSDEFVTKTLISAESVGFYSRKW